MAAVGTLAAWITVREPLISLFDGHLPVTIGIVELADADQVRLLGQIVDVDSSSLHLGQAMTSVFVDLPTGQTLLNWTTADSRQDPASADIQSKRGASPNEQ